MTGSVLRTKILVQNEGTWGAPVSHRITSSVCSALIRTCVTTTTAPPGSCHLLPFPDDNGPLGTMFDGRKDTNLVLLQRTFHAFPSTHLGGVPNGSAPPTRIPSQDLGGITRDLLCTVQCTEYLLLRILRFQREPNQTAGGPYLLIESRDT